MIPGIEMKGLSRTKRDKEGKGTGKKKEKVHSPMGDKMLPTPTSDTTW